jgi:hypothetical protein
VRQAAIDAGKQEVVIAQGLSEADRRCSRKSLPGCDRDQPRRQNARLRDRHRRCATSGKNQIGATLVNNAEKAIAARK